MKKIIIAFLVLPFLAFPSVSSAAQLTSTQANAIIGVLVAFGADASVIAKVRAILFTPATVAPATVAAPSATIQPTAVAPAPVAPLPIINFGSITMEDKSAVLVSLAHKAPADPKNDMPYGEYILKAQVLDASGAPVNGVPVSMEAPNNLYGAKMDRVIDTTTNLHSKDYYHQFGYLPTKKGIVDIVFTSGNLSTTFKLSVE